MCAKVNKPGAYYAPWSEAFRAEDDMAAHGVRWNGNKKLYERNASHGTDKRAKWEALKSEGRVKYADLTDEYKKTGVLSSTSSNADYIDFSFSKDTDNVITFEKEGPKDKIGHIRKLEYNSATLVLRVTFTNNGNMAAYFRVPSVVAGELLYLAKTDSKQISTRTYNYVHTLGVRFWDLVRIRGTIHGSRFAFVYTTDNGAGGAYAGGLGHKNRPIRKGVSAADLAYVDTDSEIETMTDDSMLKLAREFDTEYFRNENKKGAKVDSKLVLRGNSGFVKADGNPYSREVREQLGAAYQAYQLAKQFATPTILQKKIDAFNTIIKDHYND